MKRHVWLLLLLLTACAKSSSPQNTPVGQQEGKNDNQVVSATQVLNNANFMGENREFAGSTPIPTIDPEKERMLSDIQALNDRLDAQRVKLESRAAEIAASNAQASADNLKAIEAQIDAQKDVAQKALDIEREKTAQKNIDNERILAQAELAKAEAETARARSSTMLTVFATVLFVAIMLLVVRMLTLNPDDRVAEIAIHPESVTRPNVPVSPTGISTRPLPVDPDTFARFLRYAMQGKPLGANTMSDKEKIVTRTERALILPYLQKLGYLASSNGASVLSDDAVKWGGNWMEKYSPSLSANIHQNMPLMDHTHEDHAMNTVENTVGGRVDPFNITPTYDNFSPENTGGVVNGILMTDKQVGGE